MIKIKDISRPLIVVGLVIIFTLLLSFIPKNTKIMNYKLKKIDMLMDVKPDSVIELELNDEPEMQIENNLN